jgi:monoamine oxidase
MAGLTAARHLVDAGLSVTVVEARDRLGGRIHTVRDFCSEPIEAGAEFIHGAGAEHWEVARQARVRTRPSSNFRGVMFDVGGGAQWLPLVLLHPRVWPTFTILRALRAERSSDLSAREFIERRGFRGRARVMAEMVLTAHLPGSVDEVGVLGLVEDQVLTLETGLNHRVSDGYDRLPGHLAHDLDIRIGFDVEAVVWRDDAVRLRSRSGEEVSARYAVCTLPVGVLQSNRVRFFPQLPQSKRQALEQMVMGPVVKVLLGFTERFWPKSMGMVASGVGPVTLYWAVFHALDGAAPPVLCAYATGPRAAKLSSVGEEEAAHICIDDLTRMFPKAQPAALLDRFRRIDWTSDPFSCGGYTFLRPGGTGARARLAASDTGALFWAGSATATGTIAASVQAAYVSGQRAAREILQRDSPPRSPCRRWSHS